MKRRIAVVTGTRAEYGALRSTLDAIRSHPALELQLIVTGMHLSRSFGATWREIERDGYAISARVRMQNGDDSPLDQAQGLGRGIAGVASALNQLKADVVLVLGDRIEAMAGALAAVSTGRVLAHVHGGDVALGDFDDSLRHALTKLTHLHFVASADAARRVIRLGEARERVFRVGAPGLDRLFELRREKTLKSVAGAGGVMVVQHPCGRSAAIERAVMRNVLDAVAQTALPVCIIHPNSDRGHSGVVAAIEEFRASAAGRSAHVVRSLPRDEYLRMLLSSRLLVGNSSSGILAAPAAGVPSVNIGDRQAGRLPGGKTILHSGESRREIAAAVRTALRLRPHRATTGGVYGSGRAGARIAELLAKVPLGTELLRKRISY